MGCAGSKPHSLLPSSTQHHPHHVNSPQKGFIIFNEKTIEYIKAYENELRDIIKTRSEQKLFANKTLKLKNNEKLVTAAAANANKSANSGNGVTSGGEETTPKLNKKNGNATTTNSNDTSILNTTISNINEKESAIIDSAVDSVLKYAINDFDIENFKSSNHLSMKQIRKDILKKQSNATPILKANDHAFYKKALNTAIDEFGALMQERFIQINEFRVSDASAADKCLQNEHDQSSSTDNGENKSKISSANHKADDNNEDDVNQQHTLTLREALEIARHNFYKGKLSMVSMTKSGGYIVKEVKEDQNQGTIEETANTNNNEPISSNGSAQTPSSSSTAQATTSEINNLLPKTVTMLDTETQKTSKIAFAPQINIEDVDISATFKIIETDLGSNVVKNDNFSTRSINGSNNSSSQNTSPAKEIVNDNVAVVEDKEISNEERQQMEQEETRQHILDLQYLRTQFIDSQETIKTLLKDTINSVVQFTSKTSNSVPQDSDIVKENLEKCIHVIEILNNDINERDYELIDKKLIKNVVNLGYINKEFLDYLNVLQRSNTDVAYSQAINDLQTEAKELNELLNKVPKNLFVVSGVSSDVASKVDVKRGIAFSILNMGEVLAKTIDYYSLPHPEVLLENQQTEPQPQPQEVQQVQQPQQEQLEQQPQQLEQTSDEDNASAKLSTNIEDYCNKQFYDLNNIQNTPQPPVELKMQTYNNNDQQNESLTSMDIDNKNNQNDYTSTSISSPSDLLSSLSSSSEASPSKNDIVDQSKKLNASLNNNEITNENASSATVNNIEKNTVQDDMAYLVEQMQKSLSTQIDCIIANSNGTENGHHSVDNNVNDQQSLSNDQPTTSSTVTTVNSERQDQPTSNNGTCKKRLSIDEELLNQIETVDKKVKYVSETCSENDDDDDDEINNDYDNDNERLFNPKPRRLPIGNNNEIHEELKQISNVIQDLVQSINGHTSSNGNGNGATIEESTSTFSEVILSPVDNNNTEQQVEIHTTTITTTTTTSTTNSTNNDNNQQDNSNNINIDHLPQMIPDRKSISSISSNSSIPIRTKFLTKQKATALEDDLSTTASPAKMNLSIDVNDSFSNDTMRNSFNEQTTTTTPEIMNNSKSSKKKNNKNNNNNNNNNNNFKSKLPVKK